MTKGQASGGEGCPKEKRGEERVGSRPWTSSLPLPHHYIPARTPSGTGPFRPGRPGWAGPHEPDFPPQPAASSSRASFAGQMRFRAGPQSATRGEETQAKGGKRALGQPLSIFHLRRPWDGCRARERTAVSSQPLGQNPEDGRGEPTAGRWQALPYLSLPEQRGLPASVTSAPVGEEGWPRH